MFPRFGAEIFDYLRQAGGPLLVMVVGPNGAGKSTCYRKYLKPALESTIDHHIDPDAIEREIRENWDGPPCSQDEFSLMAKEEADFLRQSYLQSRLNFSFETVFSDAVGDKLGFMQQAIDAGYTVVLLAVGLDSAQKSKERVALRVMRHGHDVPLDRILSRYDRVLMNMVQGVQIASIALVVDNSRDQPEIDGSAYEPFLLFREGQIIAMENDPPQWWDRGKILVAGQSEFAQIMHGSIDNRCSTISGQGDGTLH